MFNHQKRHETTASKEGLMSDNVQVSPSDSKNNSPKITKENEGAKELESDTRIQMRQDSSSRDFHQFSTVNLRASPNSRSVSSDDHQTSLAANQAEIIGKDKNFAEWSFTEDVIQSESTKFKTPSKQKLLPKTIFLKELHAPVGGVSPFTVPIQGKPIHPEVYRVKGQHTSFSCMYINYWACNPKVLGSNPGGGKQIFLSSFIQNISIIY